MDTIEDAIYYLKNSSKHLPNDIWDGTDEIIEFLQQGEKYKQIINDIEYDFNNLHCNIISENSFNIIKQKYFPKEVKNEIYD